MDSVSFPADQAAVFSVRGVNNRRTGGANASSAETADDSVQLSPAARMAFLAGRIALDKADGKISDSEASSLYAKLATIGSQIKDDVSADGDSLSAADVQQIEQSESDLSAQIYQAAGTVTNSRSVSLAGRIAIGEKNGTLTSDQAAQYLSEVGSIRKQEKTDGLANGGGLTVAQRINFEKTEDALSTQIYSSSHPQADS